MTLHEQRASVGGKLVESGARSLEGLAADQLGRGVRALGLRAHATFLHALEALGLLEQAKRVERDVAGDLVKPRPERALGIVGVERAEDAQERLLERVLGERLVADEVDEERVDRVPVPLEERAERGRRGEIAASRLGDESAVFGLVHFHRRCCREGQALISG